MQEFFLKHKKRIIGAGIAILVLVTVIASGIKLNATLLESAIGVVVTPFSGFDNRHQQLDRRYGDIRPQQNKAEG